MLLVLATSNPSSQKTKKLFLLTKNLCSYWMRQLQPKEEQQPGAGLEATRDFIFI
jgi:hypothetical protein